MMHLILVLSVFCSVTYGCPAIISRSSWLAADTRCSQELQNPVPYVFIHHTTGRSCPVDFLCRVLMKVMQYVYMVKIHDCDIGYNFLVGGDGTIYEGRGWRIAGATTLGYDYRSIGIAFIGTFTSINPSTAAQKAVKALIACGVENNFIDPNYILKGHRDVSNTDCPGNSLYETIREWPHFG